MRLPKTFEIHGRRYSVRLVKPSKIAKCGENRRAEGEADPAQRTVKVSNDLCGPAQLDVYEHEVGHASCEESGAREVIRRFTKNEKAADDLEELLVSVWLPAYTAGLRSAK